MTGFRRTAFALVLALPVLGLAPAATGLATFTPTRFDDPPPGNCDPGDCSLREAVLAANASAGPDEVVLSTGTYILAIPEDLTPNDGLDGDLDVLDSVTITGTGPASTVVDANGAVTGERAFHLDPESGGVAPVVSMSGMTLTGGAGTQGRAIHIEGEAQASLTDMSFVGNDGTSFGGAINTRDDSVTTIAESTISNNLSTSYGAGAFTEGDAVLTVVNSTVSGNEGSYGAGLMAQQDAHLIVEDSLVVGNRSISSQGGGGIFLQNQALATLRNVTVANNSTTTQGGGFHIKNTASLTVTDSAITGNSAVQGGGFYLRNFATLVLTNSTVSGNQAAEDGGGFSVGDPPDTPGVTISSSTVTANTADSDGNGVGEGGGIAHFIGSISLGNTILAGNSDPTSEPDCDGTVGSSGNNIVGIVSAGCTFPATAGDVTGTPEAPVDPLLGPLADNGGPTQTHALLAGSPAIGAAGSGAPTADQRGAPRVGTPDAGAYERVFCRGRVVNRVGTDGPETLTGTGGKDGILALGGKDKLRGKGGADGLCGGPGKDVLRGGAGKDRLNGGPGRDTCVGQGGKDKARACEKQRGIP